MASTHRAVAAFLDLAETSLSPRGTVSHTGDEVVWQNVVHGASLQL